MDCIALASLQFAVCSLHGFASHLRCEPLIALQVGGMPCRPWLKDGRLQPGIIRHVRAETFGMAEPDLPPLARSFDRDPARVDFILIDLLAAEAAGTPSDFSFSVIVSHRFAPSLFPLPLIRHVCSTPAGPSATRPLHCARSMRCKAEFAHTRTQRSTGHS